MVKEIPLQYGMVALVDDEDFEKVNNYKWEISGLSETNFKVKTTKDKKSNRKSLTLQRIILNIDSDDKVILFKDNNPLNCQKENLVISDKKTRVYKSRGRRNSSSKYKGVSWVKKTNKWRASIHKDGKSIYLGSYLSEDEAALVYNKAALEYLSNDAYQNVIGKNNNSLPLDITRKRSEYKC